VQARLIHSSEYVVISLADSIRTPWINTEFDNSCRIRGTSKEEVCAKKRLAMHIFLISKLWMLPLTRPTSAAALELAWEAEQESPWELRSELESRY
jgi:hypothetical protein